MKPIDVFQPNAAVRLTVIGADQPVLDGRVLSMNGGMVRLTTAAANRLPAAGAPVRVEGADALLLCEIRAVQPEKNQWTVVLEVAHSLSSLSELERLNRALLGERTPVPSLRSASDQHRLGGVEDDENVERPG